MSTAVRRKLGRSGIEVSGLGMGCWAIGGAMWRGETPVGWGKVDDQESLRALQAALDEGVNFFDTSNAYGTGHSERLLGQAFSKRREQVVIATKFGNLIDESTRQLVGADASPEGIRRACENSLRRLNTDYIDLYQFHLGGYELEKAGEVRQTLEELVGEGKVLCYGWSTDSVERARFFAQGEHCAAVQHQLNVLEDTPQMLAMCEQLDLASINRGPLAMGLLTGKYTADSHVGVDDVRGEKSPDWMRYFNGGKPNPVWLGKLAAIREVLTAGGRSLAQGALAWLWARSPQTIPIPGFKTVAQVQENSRAMRFGPLTNDEMAEIRGLLESEED